MNHKIDKNINVDNQEEDQGKHSMRESEVI